ncbi:Soluble lytic murein transglycosylase [Rhizobiales bacterium GAS113]|nr:Soluble lytic murein transglycosylase [Rhizobiales bacterium GAS113]
MSCALNSMVGLLVATAWAVPASAGELVGLPAPVEWASGPAESVGALAADSAAPSRAALRAGATATAAGSVLVQSMGRDPVTAPASGPARVLVAKTEGALATSLREPGAAAGSRAPAADAPPMSVARGGCATRADVSVSDVRALIARTAGEEGADAKLADAVAAQESRYDQRPISPKGAIGVMQLMPETARHYEVDPCELKGNIRGGARYLRDLSAEFGGNVMLVLAAYNAGADRVYAAKGVPPIAETVRYVAAVTNAYYGFENALSLAKGGRSPVRIEVAMERPPTSRVTSQADSGDRWIGGSVLYVDQSQGGDQ